jgi:hypothetical protein
VLIGFFFPSPFSPALFKITGSPSSNAGDWGGFPSWPQSKINTTTSQVDQMGLALQVQAPMTRQGH